jgi:hypothetical protein
MSGWFQASSFEILAVRWEGSCAERAGPFCMRRDVNLRNEKRVRVNPRCRFSLQLPSADWVQTCKCCKTDKQTSCCWTSCPPWLANREARGLAWSGRDHPAARRRRMLFESNSIPPAFPLERGFGRQSARHSNQLVDIDALAHRTPDTATRCGSCSFCNLLRARQPPTPHDEFHRSARCCRRPRWLR